MLKYAEIYILDITVGNLDIIEHIMCLCHSKPCSENLHFSQITSNFNGNKE